MAEEMLDQDPVLSVDDFAAKVKAKYPQYDKVDNSELVQKMITKYPEYKAQVNFGTPEKKSLSGGQSFTDPNSLTSANIPQFSPITDPALKQQVQKQTAHQELTNNLQAQRANNPNPTQPKEDKGIIDRISQAAYLPAFNKTFSDFVVKPLAGASDFVDRTFDKAYTGITGQETPKWLRNDPDNILNNAVKYYDDAYDKRDKPSNIGSEVMEGTVGALPLVAAMATGQGEANILTKAPQIFSNMTKLFAGTGALNSFKDATDQHKDYLTSLNDASTGAFKGTEEGLKLDAQMLLGGALGKGVANAVAKRGLLAGGKATEAVLHALGVGTIFGGTSAGQDLLEGKDIDTHEAMKQFGMGLAFESIPIVKGIKDEVGDRNINKKAAQAAATSNSAANLNAESAIRTLITTPKEQLLQIRDNVPDSAEKLYTDSIESGAKAYESKDSNEKRNLYTNQLALKTQADVKLMADKLSDPTAVEDLRRSITESTELQPEQKADLLDKIESLKPNEEVKPNTPVEEVLPTAPQAVDRGNEEVATPQANEETPNNQIININPESNEKATSGNIPEKKRTRKC